MLQAKRKTRLTGQQIKVNKVKKQIENKTKNNKWYSNVFIHWNIIKDFIHQSLFDKVKQD